jgi:hypothetical protein
MPQLDALTYFSQFIYLLISFIAVYIFILNTIIPKIVSAQKIRQKVNSVANLNSKLNAAYLSGGPCHSVKSLRSSKWYDSTKPCGAWITSARALQIATTLGFKKRLCGLTLARS